MVLMNVTIHGSASIIGPKAIYHKRPFSLFTRPLIFW
jgi:hypothetical protein